jgi:pc21g19350 protein
MSLMEKLRQKRAEMEAAQQKAEAPKTLEEIVEAKQPSSEETQEQKQEETTVSVADTKEEPTAVTEESTPKETSVEVEPEPVADNTPSEDKDYTTMQPVVSEEKENENEIIAEDTASEETEETVKEESKTTEETTGEEGVEEKPKRRGRPRKHKEEDVEESNEEEDSKPEPTPEILSAIEEDITEQEKEDKPKKKSTKKHESVEQISYVSIDVLGEKLDVDTATAEYLNYFIDTEWQEKEKYFLDKVTNIRIEADMNPGTLKFTLADLCALNDEVMPHYLEQKKIYDSLVNKDFGSATAFKIANSTGSNSEERKRTGTLALMKAKINGQEINYISLINAVQMRYNSLNEIMKMIKYKSDICITMASAIKTEMQLVNG